MKIQLVSSHPERRYFKLVVLASEDHFGGHPVIRAYESNYDG